MKEACQTGNWTTNMSSLIRINSSIECLAIELPEEMRFTSTNVMVITILSILMVISIFGNTLVLCALGQKQHKRHSRVNVMLLHLVIADLMVTLIMMPLEIGWAWTVQWRAGDIMCRIMMFFRAFGLYLSSFVLVCISIDRYFAVMQPLRVTGADRRVKVMLAIAWVASVLCSVPQTVVFHLDHHETHKWFSQCGTFNHFTNKATEMAYNAFVILTMFGVPLIVILATYTAIIVEISTRSRDCDIVSPRRRTCSGNVQLRRSGTVTLHRARARILRLTFIMVGVFILCWTPYNVMSIMFWVDKDRAQRLPYPLQRALFLFAASNSCMNPMVYGVLMMNCASPIRAARKTIQVMRLSKSAGTTSYNASDHSCRQMAKKHSMEPVTKFKATRDWTGIKLFKTDTQITLI